MTKPPTETVIDAYGPNPSPRATGNGYAALQGVGRAMAILEALARRPMRAKELAKSLQLKWTTTYRTLSYLEEHDYLVRDPGTGEYRIGPRSYVIGAAYLAGHPLTHIALPHLRAVSDEMRCAAQVNERQGRTVITIAGIESPTSIRKTSPAFTFPLGVAAKGQLLLAFAPTAVQESVLEGELPRFTEHTIVRPEVLRARLEEIQRTGFAVTREDLQVGVGSVAAPVRDARADVVACVSAVVASSVMDDDAVVGALVASARNVAMDVSMALGWRQGSALSAR